VDPLAVLRAGVTRAVPVRGDSFVEQEDGRLLVFEEPEIDDGGILPGEQRLEALDVLALAFVDANGQGVEVVGRLGLRGLLELAWRPGGWVTLLLAGRGRPRPSRSRRRSSPDELRRRSASIRIRGFGRRRVFGGRGTGLVARRLEGVLARPEDPAIRARVHRRGDDRLRRERVVPGRHRGGRGSHRGLGART
jgi:hypothetical protein